MVGYCLIHVRHVYAVNDERPTWQPMDIAPLTYPTVGNPIFPATVHKENLPCNITEALRKAGSMAFKLIMPKKQYISNSRARQVDAPVMARTNAIVVAGINIMFSSIVYVDANRIRIVRLRIIYLLYFIC